MTDPINIELIGGPGDGKVLQLREKTPDYRMVTTQFDKPSSSLTHKLWVYRLTDDYNPQSGCWIYKVHQCLSFKGS